MSLGVERPKVAILAAVETVTSKMPATIDAAALCKMAERGQITGGLLDGPLAFDNAISKEAAKIERHRLGGRRRSRHPARARPRGRQHPGQAADVSWPTPTAPALVLGARVPIILTSRADSVRSRIASCAVAVLARRHARGAAQRDRYGTHEELIVARHTGAWLGLVESRHWRGRNSEGEELTWQAGGG